MTVSREELDSVRSLDLAGTAVRERALAVVDDPAALLRFVYRFTSWNSEFGSGVSSLAGKIGRCRSLFIDRDEALAAAADRSVMVGSYIFGAARDEFDDSATPWRDTHRCLAQAFLKGIAGWMVEQGQLDAGSVDAQMAEPMWLRGLIDHVSVGYGAGSRDDYPSVFRAIGFHLGSEVLADQEFTMVDRTLREARPDLVKAMLRRQVTVGEASHKAYHWVGIHSDFGGGGGVEAEHFAEAIEGANLALRYCEPDRREACKHQLLVGFRAFADDHDEFFDNVNG